MYTLNVLYSLSWRWNVVYTQTGTVSSDVDLFQCQFFVFVPWKRANDNLNCRWTNFEIHFIDCAAAYVWTQYSIIYTVCISFFRPEYTHKITIKENNLLPSRFKESPDQLPNSPDACSKILQRVRYLYYGIGFIERPRYVYIQGIDITRIL